MERMMQENLDRLAGYYMIIWGEETETLFSLSVFFLLHLFFFCVYLVFFLVFYRGGGHRLPYNNKKLGVGYGLWFYWRVQSFATSNG